MADEAPTGTPSQTPAPPWHQGIDADLVGAWQNKGYDLTDPVKVAVETGKAWREAEKMIGVPRDQLVRLPQNNTDPNAWRPVWERLGAPKDAKDYDFASVKFTDGTELDPGLVEAARAAFHARGVPKDTAVDITKTFIKYLENQDISERTALEGRQRDELARLTALWGPNIEENKAIAFAGIRRLGLTAEQVKGIEREIGMDATAEMMRKYGSATAESPYHAGGKGGHPPTAEAARAQWNDLKADKEYRARMLANPGGPEAKQFKELMQQITGISEAAELANL